MVPSSRGDANELNVKPRVVVKGATGRRHLIENYALEKGEYLVEVTDRITEHNAFLVQPTDPRAEVVGKFVPVLRKALFSDGAELRIKTIYKVRELKGIERTLDGKTGRVIESRMLNLFVIKRADLEL
jgi:hypothetical protein